MKKTALRNRMKKNYENRTKQFLTRRLPTLIRLDGKAFHTYTKGLDRPFDEGLIEDMQEVTKFLCSEIQGAKCGYTQSDEITILLTDFDNLNTDAWFDYNVQKMTSIAASLATAKFNQLRQKRLFDKYDRAEKYYPIEFSLTDKLAYFDARVFQIPEFEEVVNCFIWRQRDAVTNSISMLAQSLFSHGTPTSELFKKNTSEMQEMCFQKGHNWNDLHWSKKRGSFIVKLPDYIAGIDAYGDDNEVVLTPMPVRNSWKVIETPDFAKDRDSIRKLLNINSDGKENSFK